MSDLSRFRHSIISALILTYAYVSLEWLFFVTKPSFFSIRPWTERIIALFVGVLPFLIATLAVHLVLCILAGIVRRHARGAAIGAILLKAVPAAIVAAIVLMLVDNFTYTFFKWGIVKTGHYTAPLYWLLLLVVFVAFLQKRSAHSRTKLVLGVLLPALSLASLAWCAMGEGLTHVSYGAAPSNKALPNIIMFASDGVNADHMSAYGYRRNTTPNLDSWLSRSLVADNAFTNSGMTTGSLTSMMTGKYPATTKVFYPPQTLKGEDAYEHLPRMLRKLGYKSLQETIGYFADAKDLNWLDSFNYANGRELHWSRVDRLPFRLQASGQFAERARVRLQVRAEHLLFIKRMIDNYAGVVPEPERAGLVVSDDKRMKSVFNFIKNTRQPFFIHLHLMDTHCCKWHPKTKSFHVDSDASTSDQEDALFDDTILESDKYFGQMMDLLAQEKILDNTIVVYTADHIKGWDFRSQVPLIFIFPHGEHRGSLTAPAQLLDVAPTILDYLNVKIPDWMEGRSVLRDGLPKYRPIFVGYLAEYVGTSAHRAEIGPPRYDLAKAGLVVCNQWYILSLADRSVTFGTIPSYHGSCAKDKLPDEAAARALITKHLYERGFRF